MKKFVLLLYLLLLSFNFSAQVPDLLGSYGFDGPTGDGYLYTIIDGQFSPYYNFTATENPGKYPLYGMITNDDDTYYGLLLQNDLVPAGAIFKFTRSTDAFQIVYQFSGMTTIKPNSPLVLMNHKLYGIATNPSPSENESIIYAYDLVTGQFDILYQDNQLFNHPNIGLMGHNNHLYGIARATLFDFNTNNNTLNILHNFTQHQALDGYKKDLYNIPLLHNGKLYGAIASKPQAQNNNDYGILFEYDLNTQTVNILHHISEGYPSGQLAIYNNKFYGVKNETPSLYVYDLSNQTYQDLYTFNQGQRIVGNPGNGGVSFTANYLTGFAGNSLFAYDLVSNSMNELQNLNNAYRPYNNIVTPTNNSELLGITYNGGTYKFGEIFSYDFQNTTYLTLKNLNATPYGSMPYGQLTQLNGKVYGLTKKGGAHGFGTIYELDHGNMTVLYNFNSYHYFGKLLIDQNKIIFLENNSLMGIDLTTHQVETLNTYTVYIAPDTRLVKASNGYYYTLNEMKFIRINPTDYTLEELTGDTTGIIGLNSEITELNGKLYGFSNCACLCWPLERGMFAFDLLTLQVTPAYSEAYYTDNLNFDDSGMELSECNGTLYGISKNYHDIYGSSLGIYSASNSSGGCIGAFPPIKGSLGQKFLNTGNGKLLYIWDNSIVEMDTNQQSQVVFSFPMTEGFQAYGSLSLLDTAGIKELLADKILVYPNPAKDYVYIINNSGYKANNYRIIDLQGKQITGQTPLSGKKIDLSKLANGTYNIQIQIENNFVVNKKIIKH